MLEIRSWWGFALACGVAVVGTLVIVLLFHLAFSIVGRRKKAALHLVRTAKIPFRILAGVVLLWCAITVALPLPDTSPWSRLIDHTLLIAAISSGTWLGASAAIWLEDLGLAQYHTAVHDLQYARRVRTQVLVIRRLTIVIAVVIAIGASLLTFPGVRAVGASILASAGLIGVVAGIAAQSSLGNVFAGIQLAFSGAIRIDDVVVADEEWGRIEEITLTYVVVHAWDDRRIVLPSTYFTTQPFENWSRKSTDLLGEVNFDLDWQTDPVAMRSELDAVLKQTDLWDGRVGLLQVADAIGGYVRIRVLVSAADAGALFDLRCYVREGLIVWMRHAHTASIPHARVQVTAEEDVQTRARPPAGTGGLFNGSPEADERRQQFTRAIPIVPECPLRSDHFDDGTSR